MSLHQQSEHESNSVTSTPRSDNHVHGVHTSVRLMCSFGGKILPRPHDNQLRYVGGDTRIVAIHRSSTVAALLAKLSKLSGITNITIKYQLPNEDLDSLISVTTEEDVENMIEEYDRLTLNQNPTTTRLRIFLFPAKGEDSRASSISSLIAGSSINRDRWLLDAFNARDASGLERGPSEASSIISEVPDYLFGLDNSEDTTPQLRDPKTKMQRTFPEIVSGSDPGSPAPVLSSPFWSTSSAPSVPSMLNLPPVKTRSESPAPTVESKENQIASGFMQMVNPQVQNPTAYAGKPMVHYIPGTNYPGQAMHPVPLYYVPGHNQPGNVPVQAGPIQTPYIQQYPTMPGQIPIGCNYSVPVMGQVYDKGIGPMTKLNPYDASMRAGYEDGMNKQMYYGENTATVSGYPGMGVSGIEEVQGSGFDIKTVRVAK